MKRQLELLSTSPVAEIWVTLTGMCVLAGPDAVVLPLIWVLAAAGHLFLARFHDLLVEQFEAMGVTL